MVIDGEAKGDGGAKRARAALKFTHQQFSIASSLRACTCSLVNFRMTRGRWSRIILVRWSGCSRFFAQSLTCSARRSFALPCGAFSCPVVSLFDNKGSDSRGVGVAVDLVFLSSDCQRTAYVLGDMYVHVRDDDENNYMIIGEDASRFSKLQTPKHGWATPRLANCLVQYIVLCNLHMIYYYHATSSLVVWHECRMALQDVNLGYDVGQRGLTTTFTPKYPVSPTWAGW